MNPISNFLFICTQIGGEKWAKEEIKHHHPHLHLSYSRPGFLTFKNTSPDWVLGPDFRPNSLTAQHWGLSFFRCSLAELPEKLQQLASDIGTTIGLPRVGRPHCYHFWQRDDFPLPKISLEGILPLEQGSFSDPGLACGPIWDILQIERNEFWVGLHEHSPWRGLYPHPQVFFPLPREAPSRAYLKAKEALHWSQVDLHPDEWIIELGSSPGGTSYFLLQQGLNVVGIDPGKMDPLCLEFTGRPRFHHLQRPAHQVRRQDFPEQLWKELQGRPLWLFMDINLQPQVALGMAERIMQLFPRQWLGAFLTLKLAKVLQLLEVPGLMKKFRGRHFSQVEASQLPSHRQEILMLGLSKEGCQRIGKKKLSFV